MPEALEVSCQGFGHQSHGLDPAGPRRGRSSHHGRRPSDARYPRCRRHPAAPNVFECAGGCFSVLRRQTGFAGGQGDRWLLILLLRGSGHAMATSPVSDYNPATAPLRLAQGTSRCAPGASGVNRRDMRSELLQFWTEPARQSAAHAPILKPARAMGRFGEPDSGRSE